MHTTWLPGLDWPTHAPEEVEHHGTDVNHDGLASVEPDKVWDLLVANHGEEDDKEHHLHTWGEAWHS